MNLSFNFFIKAFTFFSLLFFLFGALAIIVGGPSLFVSYEWTDPSIENWILVFRLVIIMVFGAGFVISSAFFLISRRRGFASYKRIIERLYSERSTSFNLNISFPEHDEFGDLGRWLNKFVEQMRDFDKIKVERLRAFQQKISFLSEEVEKGLIFVSNEGKISYANSHFIKSFNIGDKTILGLPINRVIENDVIMETLQNLKEVPKDQEINDLRVKVGDKNYKSRVVFVPIIDSEVSLVETMILFYHIQKKKLL